jgi:branched-chain amino acid transport system ATP-binding protein
LRDEGRTIVLVDQDVRAALAIADSVHVLKAGRLDRSGLVIEFGDDLDALVRDWLSTSPTASGPQGAFGTGEEES